MSNDKKVQSAVIINGGEMESLHTNKSSLFERELYFSTDGYLYVGQGEGAKAKKIHSDQADIATKSRALDTDLIKVSSTDTNASLGGFSLSSTTLTGNSNLIPNGQLVDQSTGTFSISVDGNIQRATVYRSKIQTCHLDLVHMTDVRKIVLSNNGNGACYGTKADMNKIKNPEEGRLFFVIP